MIYYSDKFGIVLMYLTTKGYIVERDKKALICGTLTDADILLSFLDAEFVCNL